MQERGEVDQYQGDCAKFEDMVVFIALESREYKTTWRQEKADVRPGDIQNGLFQKTSMKA